MGPPIKLKTKSASKSEVSRDRETRNNKNQFMVKRGTYSFNHKY